MKHVSSILLPFAMPAWLFAQQSTTTAPTNWGFIGLAVLIATGMSIAYIVKTPEARQLGRQFHQRYGERLGGSMSTEESRALAGRRKADEILAQDDW